VDRSIDAVVATFPGVEHSSVRKPNHDFPGYPRFEIVWGNGHAQKREVDARARDVFPSQSDRPLV